MFTPAQTTVTRSTVQEILQNPVRAVEAAMNPNIRNRNRNNTHTMNCEQVSIDYGATSNPYHEGLTVFTTCSSEEATHFVEWKDSLGIDSMNMCTMHAEEFVEDAETTPDIEGYVIQELPPNSATEYPGYL